MMGIWGCRATPLTNLPFLEEAVFQAALPLESRLEAPLQILVAPNAVDNPLLDAAKRTAAEHQRLMEFPIEVGNRLREVTPNERSDIRRAWSPTELVVTAPPALSTSDALLSAWIRAEVVRPLDGALEATIEVASGEEGPWAVVSMGVEDEGSGELTWDLATTSAQLGTTPPAELPGFAADYEDRGVDIGAELPVRRVDVRYDLSTGLVRNLTIVGDIALQFEGLLSVTDDERTLPGAALVVHTENGGWGRGAVFDGKGETEFEACWGPFGEILYAAGGTGIETQGVASECPAGSFQDFGAP